MTSYFNRLRQLFVLLFGLGILAAAAPSSSVPAEPSCDALYSRRGTDLLPAAACYQDELNRVSVPGARLSLYERAFIALSAVVTDSPKTPAEIAAIAQGTELSKKLSQELPESAHAIYWVAVFKSFDAIQRDRGSVLPRNLFAVLKSLQQDLNKAISLDPSVHLWGPHRVLGLMHTQMPAIVGGDKVLAENLLREAYEKMPALCLNHLAYAKILQINGKMEQAKAVLTRFLALNDSELNPYPNEPLRSFKPETDRDRKAARELLADLNES